MWKELLMGSRWTHSLLSEKQKTLPLLHHRKSTCIVSLPHFYQEFETDNAIQGPKGHGALFRPKGHVMMALALSCKTIAR